MSNIGAVHWTENGRDAVCGDVAALGTPFMSGVNCSICRTIIELKIDLVGLQPRLKANLSDNLRRAGSLNVAIYEIAGDAHQEQYDEIAP